MFNSSSDKRRHEGATSIEYALIVGFIAVAVIFTLTSTGGSLSTLFGNTSTAIGSTTR